MDDDSGSVGSPASKAMSGLLPDHIGPDSAVTFPSQYSFVLLLFIDPQQFEADWASTVMAPYDECHSLAA